jgi:hypothetical protein
VFPREFTVHRDSNQSAFFDENYLKSTEIERGTRLQFMYGNM